LFCAFEKFDDFYILSEADSRSVETVFDAWIRPMSEKNAHYVS